MDIIIDHRIRDWVFIPLIFVMFMVSVFRFYLTQWMDNKKTADHVTSKTAVAELIDKYKSDIMIQDKFLKRQAH